MDQRQLDLQDFAIATRKATQEAPLSPAKAPPGAIGQPNPVLARQTEQEQVGNSLRRLKRANQRSIKFFVNIALDYDLKARLRRAAVENDVKMTSVVKAALDYYLAENGY